MTFLLILSINFACKEKERSLVNTKWNLVGIVDTQTGEVKELEPQDCNACYTIVFGVDSVFNETTWLNGNVEVESGWYRIFTGRTPGNFIAVWYRNDYGTGFFQIYSIGGTDAGEMGDGLLYRQILLKIQSFIVKDTSPRILYLYYNDGKNYLKYKEI